MIKDILSMFPEEILDEIKGYRGKQVLEWLKKGVDSFDSMSDLPLAFRNELKEKYKLYRPSVIKKQVSSDGTKKYLWELEDGNAVESVVMKNNYGNTVCVSTQVGCRQGCAFCASTIGGLVRSLEPSEIYNEVLCSQLDSGYKIGNIVLMGIGEPLDNYDNVIKFIRLINHPRLFNIGIRHITLSTCGIIEKFDDLANENLQITLAVSLHAPDDETRDIIMPSNRGRGVDSIIDACCRYNQKTGRRVSFEYALIDGVNDSDFQANLLSQRAKQTGAHINLITLNKVKESRFEPTTPENLKKFTSVLEKNGVNYTIRRKLGSDVDAACGQLRRNASIRNN